MRIWTGDPRGWGPGSPGGTALTIGVFDGVHRGHRALLGALAERARAAGNLGTVVVTFDVHPRSVVAPTRAPKMLATVARRLEVFEELGIDQVGVLPFGRVRRLPPREFVRRVVVDAFEARVVVAGRGFRYGAGRTGDVASLRSAGEAWGFTVETRRLLEGAHGSISSSFIRRCIADGDVEAAGDLLGRPHELPALITRTAPEEAGYGMPAAHLEVDRSMAVPGDGLYAGWVVTRHRTLPAICDTAARAAHAGSTRPIKIHLLEPEPDLRAREVGLRFAARLPDRPHERAGDEATTPIDRQITRARQILA